MVRVLIGDRRWDLRLKSASWYGGQRAAYEKLASGKVAGELSVYRVPAKDPTQHFDIMCHMVVWMPRERVEKNAQGPQDALRMGRVSSMM